MEQLVLPVPSQSLLSPVCKKEKAGCCSGRGRAEDSIADRCAFHFPGR